MRINRKTRQGAMDLPLGPANFVLVVEEAVQGYCRRCGHYETVRPLQIVEQHTATLRLMRDISRLCRWLPVQEGLLTGVSSADDGLSLPPLHPPDRTARAKARRHRGVAHR
jgi:hypothetical protein